MTEKETKATEPEDPKEEETPKRGPGRPRKKKVAFELTHSRKGCGHRYGVIFEGGLPSMPIETLMEEGLMESEVKVGSFIRGVANCKKCGYRLAVLKTSGGNRVWGHDWNKAGHSTR